MSERKTPTRDGLAVGFLMAAGAAVEAGKLVAVNAAGYAVPAADTAGLKVVGVCAHSADNSAGANGDATVEVNRMQAFLLGNSATAPCTMADIGGDVPVQDGVTVAHTATNGVVCGKLLGFEDGGCWVFIA